MRRVPQFTVRPGRLQTTGPAGPDVVRRHEDVRGPTERVDRVPPVALPAGQGSGTKRWGDDSHQPPPVAPFGLHALWRAYRVCRKGKRASRDTQAYEASLLDKLVASRDALARWSADGAWHPSRTYSFIVQRPKLREIHAAPFADRVVAPRTGEPPHPHL